MACCDKKNLLAKQYSFDIEKYWKWKEEYESHIFGDTEEDLCLMFACFSGCEKDVQTAITNNGASHWTMAFLMACCGGHYSIAFDMYNRVNFEENQTDKYEKYCLLQAGISRAFRRNFLSVVQQLCGLVAPQYEQFNSHWLMIRACKKQKTSLIIWLWERASSQNKPDINITYLNTQSIVKLLNHNVLHQQGNQIVSTTFSLSVSPYEEEEKNENRLRSVVVLNRDISDLVQHREKLFNK
jgi:hypothetical protein